MLIVGRTATALATPGDVPASASVDPRPPGHLLRPDGGGSEPRRDRAASFVPLSVARRILDRDVDLVLAVGRGRPVPVAWRRHGFAGRVEKVRGQLAPLHDPDLLIASFAAEALHARPWTPRPSAVRVAYAIRAVELAAGVALAPWPTLAETCSPAPGR